MADIKHEAQLQIARDAAFEDLVLEESLSNRSTRQFVADELPYSTNLYARVKYTSDSGDSDWSDTSRFKIKIPASVVGVCLDLKSGDRGKWWWIDAEGRKLESYDWAKHPVFKGITMVTEDSGRSPVTMTRFPLFYIKTATMGPVGTFADGKKCWWISDTKLPGFRPHPAFKRVTERNEDGSYKALPYVTIATYMSNSETVGGRNCLGSGLGRQVLHSQSYETYRTYCNNRNNEITGQVGWRVYDIYDDAMLKLLMLIMYADSNATRISNVGSMSTTGSSSNRLVFKGTQAKPEVWVDDLWRFFYHVLYNIKVEDYEVKLISPMDNTTELRIVDSHMLARTTGWMRDFIHSPVTIGDDTHNVQELFLPSIVTSTETQTPVGDTLQAGNYPYLLGHGGYNRGDDELGLFHLAMCPDKGDITYVSPYNTGCRICKN